MPTLGFGPALTAAGQLTGIRPDPYQVFNFFIEIEGLLAGGFTECSGLLVESEVEEYREGGVNDFVHRFVGASRSPLLTLRRGLGAIDSLWNWHQEVARGEIKRKNGTIYLLDKKRIPVVWWNFREAIPVRWSGPELRAESNEVAFVSVELAHRGLSRPLAEQVASGFGAGVSGALDLLGGLF